MLLVSYYCRVPTLLLKTNSRSFQDSLNVFPRTLYTARVVVNLLHAASSTANTLDQVHYTQQCNIQTHYIWNAKYFEIYCHFVTVGKSPNLALEPQFFQDFPRLST